MPTSHQRHKPKHHHQPDKHGQVRRKMTASLFMTIIGALFGVSFGYFTGDRSLTWAAVGLIVGAAVGNLFGKAIDRSVARRK
jgi:uncharacterized membrane protein YfcA